MDFTSYQWLLGNVTFLNFFFFSIEGTLHKLRLMHGQNKKKCLVLSAFLILGHFRCQTMNFSLLAGMAMVVCACFKLRFKYILGRLQFIVNFDNVEYFMCRIFIFIIFKKSNCSVHIQLSTILCSTKSHKLSIILNTLDKNLAI